MNTIIENILQLSRRERSRPQDVALLPWLENFVAEFTRDLHLAPGRIGIDITPPDVEVRMDPVICAKYCGICARMPCATGRHDRRGMRIELRGGLSPESREAVLDVIDQGRGISAEDAQQIFEPFFTTNRQGTGWACIIARELCEFNKASAASCADRQPAAVVSDQLHGRAPPDIDP